LQVNISRDEVSDSNFCIYNVLIENKSDSVACLLHSVFMNLTSDAPQGLALFIKNKHRIMYHFRYSFEDTTIIAEVILYKSEIILPHHVLNFKIKTQKVKDNLSKYLTFEYFYPIDFCYSDFIKDMDKAKSKWYLKYDRRKKEIKMYD